MATIQLLYDNAADAGTLSGGSWAIPLTNMQDPRPTKRARSTNLTTTSTTFKITLTGPKTFRSLAFGPTNFSGGGTYRIRGYSDAALSVLVVDTGTISVGAPPVSTLSLHWTDANWWSGQTPIDDPDHAGLWVIHCFTSDQTAQYWQFDLVDAANSDGFLEVGRLYMGTALIPSLNFAPDSANKFGFEVNTAQQKSAGGTRYFNRRRSARTFDFTFPSLDTDEIWTDAYRLVALSNLDKQVFVIADPDDATNRNKRSFLGTLQALPSWSLSNVDRASIGYQVVESL